MASPKPRTRTKVHAMAVDDQGDGTGVVFYECEMH